MPTLALSPDEITAIATSLASQLAPAIAEQLSRELAAAAESPSPRKMLWTEREAAAVVGVSGYTIKRWREQGLIESHSTKRPITYTWPQVERIAAFIGERQ